MVSVGDKVAGYDLVEQLGKGGFGEVFLVKTGTGRKKVMKFPLEDRLEDLRREAASHKRLQNKSIVEVEHIDADNDPPYILMEYFEGQPLNAEGFDVSKDETISILKQCCEALDYAHEQGVIHRDIKPSNILYKEGISKVLDFGLAKIRRDKKDELAVSMDDFKSVESSSGTRAYMAPEQERGEDAVPASDIHSLGQVVFELLKGRRVERGENVVQSLSKENIDEKYANIIQKMLAHDLDDRYSIAKQVLEDLISNGVSRPEKQGSFVDIPRLIKLYREFDYSGELSGEDLMRAASKAKEHILDSGASQDEWENMMRLICKVSDDANDYEAEEAGDVLWELLENYRHNNDEYLTIEGFEYLINAYEDMSIDFGDMEAVTQGVENLLETLDYKLPEDYYMRVLEKREK
jgi:serine/threonine protein kinase